ncbi:MAG: prealbumin-like fold domain-containing protein, partial [bacterium]
MDSAGDPAVHSVGDILIISDFTQGGNISTIKIYEWVGSGGDTNNTLNLLLSGQDCSVTGLSDDQACALVNDIPQTAPWPYAPKFGSSGTFPTGSLFEGGINISRIDRERERPSPGCFTSFLAETRSSQSVDATLKDFALGGFDLCNARISIEEDATNEVGDDHTFTITVEKKGSPNYSFAPAIGIEVTATLEEGSVGSFDGSNVCTTDSNGQCTVTISSEEAGSSTVSASATVAVAEVTFELETDGEGENSNPAVKTWVDAKIGIADPGTNEVGDPHTFIVTLEKNSGSGFVAASGEHVDFTLTSAFGADCVVDEAASTCDDAGANTDSNGQCTIAFSSDSAGQCVGSASAELIVGGITLIRSTDGSGENSGEATKTYVDASIAISPESDTNPIGEQHTFTITVTADDGSGSGATGVEGVFPTVTLDPTPDSVNDGCADDGVNAGTDANGQCTVVINHDSPETFTANASVTVTLGTVSLSRDTAGNSGPDGSGGAQKTYVAGNIIVVKQTDPGGSADVFTFTASYDNDGFSLKDGESNDSGPLAPGTYSVGEDSLSGWSLTSATCDDGSSPSSVGLAADETVTCTFVNTKVGKIIIEKETDPDGSDRSFSFAATYDNDGFSLLDGESNDSGSLEAGSHTITETVPEGWDLTSIQCSGETDSVITLGDGGFFGPENSVNIQLVVGETVTCTFNNKQLGKIIVEKETEPAGSGQSFSFTTDYGDGFSLSDGGSNDSGYIDPATYSVSEGAVTGWDLVSATCDDGSS